MLGVELPFLVTALQVHSHDQTEVITPIFIIRVFFKHNIMGALSSNDIFKYISP